MALFDYATPRVNFAPLAELLDPIIEGMERQRQEKLRLAALAPDVPVAPVAPASGPVVPGAALGIGGSRKMAMPADPETERKFLDTVKSSGLTNPVAVAALAAHVNAESGFSPANFTRTWSDPSESGKPGTSGGALSWRGDRLTKMLQATQGQDPVVAQAKYALAENPEMAVALQNAKSLSEAHSVLANSQRYAGYDRPGGENARRLALAQNYFGRLGGGNTAVAEADLPQAGGTPAQYAVPGQGTTAPVTSGVSPQKLAALRELAVRGSPSDSQWAKNELTRLTTAKNPMNLGNGILYDPRTGKVTDFSAAATKKPEAIQLYEYAKERGYTGSIVDFKKATGAKTEISMASNEDAGQKKLQEERAKQFGKYIEEGSDAAERKVDLDVLRQASRNLGVQGYSAAAKAALAPIADVFGVEIEGASDVQSFESIVSKMAPRMRVEGSGSSSNFDVQQMLKGLPALARRPESREMVLDVFQASAEFAEKRAEIAARVASGDLKMKDAERELKALPQPVDIYRNFRKNNPTVINAALNDKTPATTSGAKANPAATTDEGEPPPKKGAVVNGFRFRGGDPNNKGHWERIK